MTNRTDAIKLAIEALERNKRGLENIELFGKSNVKFSGLTEMIEKTGAALAALQAPNWSDIGRLIEAANGAAARGFISGTSNWAAFVSRAMGGQAREGEAVAWSDDALNRAYSDGVAYGERNYRQAIATYQAEASGYKDAYFKLVESIANLKVFEPAPPIIIAAPQPAQPSEPAQPEQGPST